MAGRKKTCAAPDCRATFRPHGRQKYCTSTCRERVAKRKQRAEADFENTDVDRSKVDLAVAVETFWTNRYKDIDDQAGEGLIRRGPKYDEFVDSGWPEAIVRGETTQADVAAALGQLAGNISRWTYTWCHDFRRDREQAGWTIDAEDQAAVEGGYRPFVERFHPHVEIRDFDMEWETEIDSVVGNGGQLLLLAPQRHGKTQFLAYYCVRRITENPDIRILWVGKTQGLAEDAVGFVRQLLEDETYCEAVLGPEETFRPPSRGGKWTNTEFTVRQRTRVMRSPTMRALGTGGTTSGRDADLIIIDDPQEREDIDDGATAGDKQRKWFFTTFLARKMPHTGIAYITSRQHPQDIPGTIIEEHADDWRVLTYRAHDPGCPEPEDEPERHTSCVLWPTERPYEFLMHRKRSDELWFECNYQNNPTTEKITLLKPEHVRAATSEQWTAGHFPPGSRLIAGFDPATSKENSSVLWAFDPRTNRCHVVDARKWQTGPMGLVDAMSEWHEKYRCTHWVTEVNLAGGFLGDTQVKTLQQDLGIQIFSHYTDRLNKVDHAGGVTSMIQAVRADPQPIIFPTLDGSEASDGVRELIRQMLAYDAGFGARSKHANDDLVLAAWFPWWRELRKLIQGTGPAKVVTVDNGQFGRNYGWTG